MSARVWYVLRLGFAALVVTGLDIWNYVAYREEPDIVRLVTIYALSVLALLTWIQVIPLIMELGDTQQGAQVRRPERGRVRRR